MLQDQSCWVSKNPAWCQGSNSGQHMQNKHYIHCIIAASPPHHADSNSWNIINSMYGFSVLKFLYKIFGLSAVEYCQVFVMFYFRVQTPLPMGLPMGPSVLSITIHRLHPSLMFIRGKKFKQSPKATVNKFSFSWNSDSSFVCTLKKSTMNFSFQRTFISRILTL